MLSQFKNCFKSKLEPSPGLKIKYSSSVVCSHSRWLVKHCYMHFILKTPLVTCLIYLAYRIGQKATAVGSYFISNVQ